MWNMQKSNIKQEEENNKTEHMSMKYTKALERLKQSKTVFHDNINNDG